MLRDSLESYFLGSKIYSTGVSVGTIFRDFGFEFISVKSKLFSYDIPGYYIVAHQVFCLLSF